MTRTQRLVLIISVCASFIAFLDGSVVNVALVAIEQELGGGFALQQWVVDGYLITLGALILVAGSLSDRLGRKRVLRAGLIGFGVASLACALAPSGVALILFRALQGAAGALLVPSSLALIISAFSGKAQGKAIGQWTALTGIAMLAGPIIGGLLVDAGSWRWVFAINVIPIAITLWLMRSLDLPEHIDSRASLDIAGAVLGALGLGATVFALIEQPRGWDSLLVWPPLVLGLGLLTAFVWHERRTQHPMLPFRLFKVRNFAYGNVATLAIYAALSGASLLITLFLQSIAGYSAVAAGAVMIPITIIMAVLSGKFGALAGQYGPRLFMTIGPIVAGIGVLLGLRMGAQPDLITEVMPLVLVLGLGLSITVAPLTTAVLADIAAAEAGIGSAVNNAVARVAGLLGVAFLGTFNGAGAAGALSITGFYTGTWVMAVLLILGGIVSFVGIRTPRSNLHSDPAAL